MSHGKRHRASVRQSTQGFRLKLNGKRQHVGRKAISTHGAKRPPPPRSPCLGNITFTKFLFWPPSTRMMVEGARMAFIIWLATWPNGCKTGSASTTMPICRSVIRLAQPQGATKAFAEAPGKVNKSCFDPRPEGGLLQINVRQRLDSAVYDRRILYSRSDSPSTQYHSPKCSLKPTDSE